MTEIESIFVSAVSGELGSFRRAAADALACMNAEPVVQDRFPTDYGELRQLLTEKISRCDKVVCLIGFGYGFEPQGWPAGEPRRSYTQIEYDVARSLNKPIITLLSDDVQRPTDAPLDEDDEKRAFQLAHRAAIEASNQLWHRFATCDDVYRLMARVSIRQPLPLERCVQVLPSGAEVLVGREEALKRLDADWFDPNVRITTMTAWGGVGKTSLVGGWLAKIQKQDWLGAERVFVWPFHGLGSAEHESASFVSRALEFFGDTRLAKSGTASPFDKGERLAELICACRTLLVLDGLESLQEPPGPLAGRLRDPALKALFECLASVNRALCSLCIVTSRQAISDLNRWRDSSVREWRLEQLDEQAGAELLRAAGVTGPDGELRAASAEVSGHALTLELLGRYLAAAHAGDVRRRDLVQFEKADELVNGGQAFQVMRAYEDWLGTGGEQGVRQLAWVRLMGLFERAADAGCLNAVLEEPLIPGLTDALVGLGQDDWNLAISNLERLRLVRRVDWKPPAVRGFDQQQALAARQHLDPGDPQDFPTPQPGTLYALEAHPLVHEYFAGWLKNHSHEGWREGHHRLYQHLVTSVPYWPEGLDGLRPLYQAIVHGCAAELHLDACAGVYRDRIQRAGYGEGYSTSVLGAVGADLAAVACFFAQPWKRVHPSLPQPAQYWVLRDAAFNLELLGRLEEALDPLRLSVEKTVEARDWRVAASRSDDLSRLELSLGRIAAATQSAERSSTYAERIGTPSFEAVKGLSSRGDALTQAGRVAEALDVFGKAEKLQGAGLPEPVLFSLGGVQYCDALMAEAEVAAWRAYLGSSGQEKGSGWSMCNAAEQSLRDVERRADWIVRIAIEQGFAVDEALGYLALAKSKLYRLMLESAIPDIPRLALEQTHCLMDRAAKIARSMGAMELVARSLTCRALARCLLGDRDGAQADLSNAWDISRRGPMDLRSADAQLSRARLFRDREALREARVTIERCGYWRRRQELDDAEAAAQEW